MITPSKLKKDDQIAIVAAGKKISSAEIQTAVNLYESWGLKVVIGKTIDAEDFYLAGNDELRRSDVQRFINDSSIKAIIFARGGYGAVRIIDQLDFTPLLTAPKWLVGFSDVTVFHNHVNTNLNLPTIHGMMPVFFPSATENAISSNYKVLFENEMNYSFNMKDNSVSKNGITQAEIVGGNLSILYSLCGSDSQLNPAGKILFIEDLFEPLYHIDRMLHNLKRNNFFKDLKGIIIGRFTDIEKGNPAFQKNIESVFNLHFSKLEIPIAYDFPSGHINNNHSLIFGQKADFEVRNTLVSIKSIN